MGDDGEEVSDYDDDKQDNDDDGEEDDDDDGGDKSEEDDDADDEETPNSGVKAAVDVVRRFLDLDPPGDRPEVDLG